MSDENGQRTITERPILFSAPMVRAILAGAKTQTRRVAPIEDFSVRDVRDGMVAWRIKFTKPIGKGRVISSHSGGKVTHEQAASIVGSRFCPCGRPGEKLYVKESHEFTTCNKDGVLQCIYRADGAAVDMFDAPYTPKLNRGRPSIHMPRWASRITLEITDVRVERLQDMNRGDAMEEGCPFANMAKGRSPIDWYAELWDQINGAGSWERNDWVWVISFRRLAA